MRPRTGRAKAGGCPVTKVSSLVTYAFVIALAGFGADLGAGPALAGATPEHGGAEAFDPMRATRAAGDVERTAPGAAAGEAAKKPPPLITGSNEPEHESNPASGSVTDPIVPPVRRVIPATPGAAIPAKAKPPSASGAGAARSPEPKR